MDIYLIIVFGDLVGYHSTFLRHTAVTNSNENPLIGGVNGTIWPICAESAVKPQPTYWGALNTRRWEKFAIFNGNMANGYNG